MGSRRLAAPDNRMEIPMTRIRNLLLCASTLVTFAACGGSGTGDVTIATDDPPPGSKASPTQTAPIADASADRGSSTPASTTAYSIAGSPGR